MGESSNLMAMLPGGWHVVATNFPKWLDGTRLAPRFHYEVQRDEPLTLRDTVSYRDAAGREQQIVGRDTWRNDHFVWRGSGLLHLTTSRWRVAGGSDDGMLLAIRFERTLFTPAGVDILARNDSQQNEPRTVVAGDTARFGLSPEDFASLSWLAPDPRP